MTLGQRIQMCRKRNGLSQEALGERIGVSRQAVSKWEKGQAQPDLDRAVRLADAFGITVDELLKGMPDELADDGTVWVPNPNLPFRGWEGRRLRFTKLQIALIVSGWALVGIMLLCTLAQYMALPAGNQIPLHWGADGAANRWGDKNDWLGGQMVSAVISIVLYAGLNILGHFPQVWNVPVRLTEGNWQRVYTGERTFLYVVGDLLAATFLCVTVLGANLSGDLPVWYLPLFLIVFFGAMAATQAGFFLWLRRIKAGRN